MRGLVILRHAHQSSRLKNGRVAQPTIVGINRASAANLTDENSLAHRHLCHHAGSEAPEVIINDRAAIGIDFGTTNSSIARATGGEGVELVRFPIASGVTEAYRSLLYLELHKE